MAKADLSIIKIALEHATFADFRIRDGLNSFLNSMQLDMDEIGMEVGSNTDETVNNLEEIIAEVESPIKMERELRINLDDNDNEGVREVEDTSEVEVKSTKVVNVDEELDEFGV